MNLEELKVKRTFIILSLSFLLFLFCGGTPEQQTCDCGRIISLAPSITETLFALGLGDRVVGVTTYCKFPVQAKSIEKVGGYVDANLEKIATLKPDLVILQKEHERQKLFLSKSGIRTVTVNYGTVAGVCSSFANIGRACGVQNRADSLIALFDTELRIDPDLSRRPGILICIGRDNPGSGGVRSIYAAGAGSFYNTLIEAAGGKNVFSDSVPQYPKLSREGLLTLAPDIIVDIAPSMGDYNCEELKKDWLSATMVPAVRSGQVYCLSGDYTTIPGPRVLHLKADLQELIKEAEY